MKSGSRLSIRSKLVMLLLLASIVSMLVVAWQGYRSGKDALTHAVINQLTTLREAKSQQVAAYLSDIHDQVLALSENSAIVAALDEFRTAYRLAEREELSPKAKQTLSAYYRNEFIPRLKDRMGGEPEVGHYMPEGGAAAYLQYHYIAANPNKVGEKDRLVHAAGDTSYYAQVHARYHERLRSLLKRFGYYDLFLIDHETGNVLYTVSKETDFATSLQHGPYSASNFARMAKEIMRTRERGKARFEDFDIYVPSYGVPAAFVATTVYDGKEIAGILALQVPSDELNDVMTSARRWEESGMGRSGEVYLVGRNHLMRSDSRFLIQEPERYLKRLRDIRMPDADIARIRKLNTTILFQPVHEASVDLALAGKTGVEEVVDYRGVPVLSAYAPLRAQGFDWVILSEMDRAEIDVPVDRFRRQVLVSATIIGIIVTLLALFAASYFIRPIHALVGGLRRVAEGHDDVVVEVANKDEFGELAHSFNRMVGSIRAQKREIKLKDEENRRLLENVLPGPVAERVRQGETQVVDRVGNVSIVFTALTGLIRREDEEDPVAAIERLNALVSRFDEAAERYGVDKIKTIGDDYMAACGLITPRLDHAKRAFSFAREMMDIVQRSGAEYGLDLRLRVGIHSGAVLAGVVGRRKFVYDVWGSTVDVASEIRFAAAPGSICVSDQTLEHLHDTAGFVKGAQIQVEGAPPLHLWCLKPGARQGAGRA